MAAIRIIDDHLELANIGTNTHAQIDTHIAAADDYVKRDGSLALTADWDIGDTRKIKADEIWARDGAGLKLYDDGGNGVFVEDGGDVGIGTAIPGYRLDVDTVSDEIARFSSSNIYSRVTIKNNNSVGFSQFNCGTDNAFNAAFFINYGSAHANAGNFALKNGYGDLKLYTGIGGSSTEKFTIKTTGKVGIGTNTPTAKLDINSDIFRLRTAKTPATAGAAGNQGDICWDASYIYVCTATNSWERAAIAAW